MFQLDVLISSFILCYFVNVVFSSSAASPKNDQKIPQNAALNNEYCFCDAVC